MAMAEIVHDDSTRSYVDWPAIFAGALIASGAVVVLTTFAAGLGLGSISADEGGEFSLAWLLLTAVVAVVSLVGSYMLGGYVTGRMRRPAGNATRDELTTRDGLNGLVVWGIGMVLSALLAASIISGGARAVGGAAQTAVEVAGTVAGGAAQGAGQLVGGIAQGAGQAAPALQDMLPEGLRSNPLEYMTDTLLRADGQPGATQPGAAQPGAATDADGTSRQITGVFGNLLRTGEISDADRAWLREQVVARTSLPPNEADARVNQAVDQVQALRADAQKRLDEVSKQAADLQAQAVAAAEQARIAAILSAFLLAAASLVGAVAAYIGAVKGGRDRDEGRIWGGLAYRK